MRMQPLTLSGSKAFDQMVGAARFLSPSLPNKSLRMRSVKLILVLIGCGVALLVAAALPPDANDPAGPSVAGSWTMGLLGVASLGAGLTLLRRGYLAARQAQGGGPLPLSTKLVLALAGVAALAMVAYQMLHTAHNPAAHSAVRVPGTMTKAEYMEQEQQEIQKRQSNDTPAPAPTAPLVPDPAGR